MPVSKVFVLSVGRHRTARMEQTLEMGGVKGCLYYSSSIRACMKWAKFRIRPLVCCRKFSVSAGTDLRQPKHARKVRSALPPSISVKRARFKSIFIFQNLLTCTKIFIFFTCGLVETKNCLSAV